jgi:hypothetical protein
VDRLGELVAIDQAQHFHGRVNVIEWTFSGAVGIEHNDLPACTSHASDITG